MERLDIVVDEVSSMGALLIKQASEGIPAVLIRGLKYEKNNKGVKQLLISNYRRTARSVLLKGLVKNAIAKLLRIT